MLAGGAVAIVVAALLAWALWPAPEEPRPREYRAVTACLLTDGQGVAGARAAPVWAGMQAASGRTLGQVRYLAVSGDQTVANAQTFVAALVLGRCAVIVAAPGIADGAVRAIAAQHPQQQFLVVGGEAAPAPNVTRIEGPDVADVVGARLAATT
jgi:hypothetical protein